MAEKRPHEESSSSSGPSIEEKFEQSVDRQRIKTLLKEKLEKCGWEQAVEERAKEYIRETGIENVQIEDLVSIIKGDVRKTIPIEVKKETVEEVQKFVLKQMKKDKKRKEKIARGEDVDDDDDDEDEDEDE